MILSQPSFALTILNVVFIVEKHQMPSFTVWGLTPPQPEPMIYCTRGKHANYYITDAVPSDLQTLPSRIYIKLNRRQLWLLVSSATFSHIVVVIFIGGQREPKKNQRLSASYRKSPTNINVVSTTPHNGCNTKCICSCKSNYHERHSGEVPSKIHFRFSDVTNEYSDLTLF